MYFIVDADVLIDYVAADLGMLTLISRCVGSIHVAAAVVSEVEDLDDKTCEDAGLVVVHGSMELLERARSKRGRLSFADHVCLLLAAENGWTCVTNDRALRRACETDGVELRWGLQLMLDLLAVDGAQLAETIAIATKIHEANRQHVDAKLLAEFIARARKTAARKKR